MRVAIISLTLNEPGPSILSTESQEKLISQALQEMIEAHLLPGDWTLEHVRVLKEE